ncbi:MAG TPA: cupredoxin family copper-binding protein [Methylomirabilota bacterium]|nr:cupredoxin family copper-binding protein [Methylomirabilota bacterium]
MKFHWHRIVLIATLGSASMLFGQGGRLSNAAGQSGSAESMAAHRAAHAAPVQGAEKATAGNEVIIDNFEFTPASLTVSVGTTVTWTNREDEAHTVNSTTDAFKSPPMDTNDKFSFEFKAPGTYPYYCKLHPQMKGQIVVQ